jgi:MFS family permease
VPVPSSLPIRRNTALLSGSLAMNSATQQLAAAVASLTLVRVLHVEGLLGLGPAVVLGAGALAALPAGLLMDRYGRVPVLVGGFALGVAGCVLACVRPDPKRIAELLAHDAEPAAPAAAIPLRGLLRRSGVVPALVAAQASFAVMVAVMTLVGAIVVDHHHQSAGNVFPIIGAHVIGMFGLIVVVGDLIDRSGRTPALAGGLLLMALSAISLLWVHSVPATAFALFVLGLGWNLSFVAATAVLADATEAAERGKLLGFNDLLAGLTGAGLALLGGLALTAIGVAALAIGGAALVTVPALWILRGGSTLRPAPGRA